ncbi:DUF1320 domain-containing protein [bacterium]|nr:DUF1320 domain-containing protein [bacterium]
MYATVSDIEKRLDPGHLIELADDDHDGQPDTAVLEAAIADADGLVDTYLQGRYAVPLDPAPALLRKLSADLAVAALFARRRETASPVHESRAKAAMELLSCLARGELLLSQSDAKTAPDSTTLSETRRFDREKLEPY